MNYSQFPEKAGWAITTYFLDAEYEKDFGEKHYGIDMAYQRKHYDGVRYIYAIADGVISAVQKSNGKTANAIQIKHYDIIAGKMVITRYYHLASFADGIKKGKEVKKGEIIGIEGKTGNATGSHLHFEFWICPTDYKFNYREVAKYAVDPLEYLYLHDGQICVHDPKGKVKTVPKDDYEALYNAEVAKNKALTESNEALTKEVASLKESNGELSAHIAEINGALSILRKY